MPAQSQQRCMKDPVDTHPDPDPRYAHACERARTRTATHGPLAPPSSRERGFTRTHSACTSSARDTTWGQRGRERANTSTNRKRPKHGGPGPAHRSQGVDPHTPAADLLFHLARPVPASSRQGPSQPEPRYRNSRAMRANVRTELLGGGAPPGPPLYGGGPPPWPSGPPAPAPGALPAC